MPKVAVLVVGAPRSGTSAVSNMLSELGVYFGSADRFVDPSTHTHNPIFFELESLNVLNDDFLAELGLSYGQFEYFIGEHEPVADKYPSFVERAQRLVANELETRDLIGLKDPRFVFTLPLWEAALGSMGYAVRFVTTERPVEDIVRSNREVYKVNEAHQRRIVLVSTGLASARLVDKDHLVVSYDDLVEEPVHEARKLANWLGLDPGASERAARVVRPELRHHRSRKTDSRKGRISPLKERADQYRAMLGVMEKYGIFDLLDSLREQLRISTSQLGKMRLSVEIEKGMEQLSTRMDSHFERVVAIAEAVQAQHAVFERTVKEREETAGKLEASLRQRISDLEGSVFEHRRTLETVSSELDTARVEVQKRDELEAGLQRRIEHLEASVLDRNRAFARASTELNIAHGDIGQLNKKCLGLEKELTDTRQMLQRGQVESETRMAALSSEADELRRQADDLRHQNAALMPLRKKLAWYFRTYGSKALLKRILLGRAALSKMQLGAAQQPASEIQSETEPVPGPARMEAHPFPSMASGSTQGPVVPAHTLISRQFDAMQPLPIFASVGPNARLNLVTDSINRGSLFGGVGTAIILSALLAEKLGARLRVVTRREPADAEGFAQVLACNNIEFSGEVEFDYVRVGDQQARLPICDGDRFLTTSWWTTACVLGSIPGKRVDYLLQEDERMFYPYGDERLRCREVLERRDIRFLINTELLYRHLIETGLDHLKENAVWFEPAFPDSMFGGRREERAHGKRLLFFYARPNNLRNLFYRGIEVLDKAVSEKMITPDDWEVVMVGKDVPTVTLGGILKPQVLPTMGWKAYGEFIKSVDLGFCLMGTPHPSYPPLDLAASGAVVLTNKFGLKKDLHQYSDNIICSGLEVSALLDGLRTAVARARDDEVRLAAFRNNRMPRSWPETLAKPIEFMG